MYFLLIFNEGEKSVYMSCFVCVFFRNFFLNFILPFGVVSMKMLNLDVELDT